METINLILKNYMVKALLGLGFMVPLKEKDAKQYISSSFSHIHTFCNKP